MVRVSAGITAKTSLAFYLKLKTASDIALTDLHT